MSNFKGQFLTNPIEAANLQLQINFASLIHGCGILHMSLWHLSKCILTNHSICFFVSALFLQYQACLFLLTKFRPHTVLTNGPTFSISILNVNLSTG